MLVGTPMRTTLGLSPLDLAAQRAIWAGSLAVDSPSSAIARLPWLGTGRQASNTPRTVTDLARPRV